jgi:hypothetical protein
MLNASQDLPTGFMEARVGISTEGFKEDLILVFKKLLGYVPSFGEIVEIIYGKY